jgi:hypothetical protein
MTHLALLNLSDADVDLLTRLARQDRFRLDALFHADPSALAARLAGIAAVPVFSDLEALADLPIDVCAGREEARELAGRLAGRARASGRPGPTFLLLEELVGALSSRDGDSAPGAPAEERAANGAGGATVPPEDAFRATGAPVGAGPPAPGAASRPAEAPRAATPPPFTTPPPAMTPAPPELGVPTIDLFYDPTRLSAWLAESAWKFAEASSAVVWRREAEGRRWTLMSFAPSADSLPPVAFPPEELEQRLRDGHLESRPVGDAAAPFRALFVPLPGEESPFGLLGVFRAWTPGDWPRPLREEFARRAVELGQALDRCVNVSRIGLELKHLRFKERIRDLLLEGTDPPAARWGRCLAALLEEVPARTASYWQRTPDGQRLEMIAATSAAGAVHGQLSIPIGVGIVGGAFGRPRRTTWFCEDTDIPGETCVVPVDAGRGAARAPVGVLLLEGVPPSDQDDGEAGRRIDLLRDLLAPILAPPDASE